jgi:hypothetical protein
MLYMIDRRPVIISALYLSIHSAFVDVKFHINSAKHHSHSECTSGLLHPLSTGLFCYCISIVSGSINSTSPCRCTLYTSNKCPPSISPHSGRKGIATKLTPKLKRKRKGIATKLTLFVRKRKLREKQGAVKEHNAKMLPRKLLPFALRQN